MQVMDHLEEASESVWRLVTVAQICDVNPKSTSPAELKNEVTFVPMQAVDADLGEITAPLTRPLTEVHKGYTRFQDGDVLFAKITPCMENGKAAIARDLIGGIGFGSTEFHVLRPKEGTLAEWIYYFIRQEWFRDYARDNFTGTAGQRRVPTEFLKNVEIPLPPLDEQRRIVGVLREALAEVRRGREALGQVAGQMKRFRQAVLAQAFRGELTTEWREAHANRFREAAEAYDALLTERGGATPRSEDLPAPLRDWLPADRLREVILADRRARWESAQLAKMAAKGGPKDDKWKAKYVEAAVPTEPEEGEIQDSWVWVSLESLTTVVTSGSRDWKRHYKVGGPGVFVMAQNIRPMRYDRSYRLEVAPPPGDRDAERSEITHRDLLVTIVGANTGDACMVDFDPVRHYVCQSVALLRPVHPGMAEYVALHLNSPWPTLLQWHDWIYGEGRPHLSFDHLKQTAVALAPLAEQREIVARIEALFAQAEATEYTAATAINNLRRLEQSTLRAAFAGEL